MKLISKQKKILHVITGLPGGGAESMLYKLIKHLDSNLYTQEVISLTNKGFVGPSIEQLGITVKELHIRGLWSGFVGLIKGVYLLYKFKPNILQGWLYHANIFVSLINLFSIRKTSVIWNIRHSVHDMKKEKQSIQLLIKWGAILSSLPNKIICNSQVAIKQHVQLGYKEEQFVFIPNGFDLSLFKPQKNDYGKLREELQLNAKTKVIGMAARYHPMKNHKDFILKVADQLTQDFSDIHFVFMGNNVTQENEELTSVISKTSHPERFSLLGNRKDVCQLIADVDIVVLPSAWGEGFPNIIGEAMACGVPCVVTDVGDSAYIVEGKYVCQPEDFKKMAHFLRELLMMPEEKIKQVRLSCRKRVEQAFSIQQISSTYSLLYDTF